MFTRWLLSFFAIITAAFLASSCSRGTPAEFPAPDFTLEDLFTGKDIHLAEYQGRPVLLYFFASW